jgi:shikimate kinase
MLVYLIGYMGSGKTTLGRRLADAMHHRFLDLDGLIEETYHITIPRVFSQYDETAFRMMEQKVLAGTLSMTDTVISTGGGTPCFFDNMERINASGVSVYIRHSASFLAERLILSKRSRPLLTGKNREELAGFIASQLAYREPWYLQSRIVVNGERLELKKLVASLVSGQQNGSDQHESPE